MKKKLIMLAVVVLSGSLFAGCGKSETSCPEGQILENGACKACDPGYKPNATKTACEIDLCGNGKVDSGEKCDKTIAAGKKGACPIDCDNKNVGESACSPYKLENAGTCQAECVQKTITEAVDGDRCCPTGKTADEDKDCTTPIGVACQQDGDCDQDAGLTCVKQGTKPFGAKAPKDGACYLLSKDCESDKDCPGGEDFVGCSIAKGSDGKKEKTGFCFPKCRVDTDCRLGYTCENEFCEPSNNWCEKDTDCNGGVGQRCSPKEFLEEGQHPFCMAWGTGTGQPGVGCRSVADCAGGWRAVCFAAGKDEGFCSLVCEAGKESDPNKGCGAGTLNYCQELNDKTKVGVCLRTCTDDAACSESGFSSNHSECSKKPFRKGGERVCTFPSLTISTIGEKCSDSAACGSGAECLKDTPFDQEGYCSADCGSKVLNHCPDGSVCVTYPTGKGNNVKCWKSCKVDSDCSRSGYVCYKQQQGASEGVCVPRKAVGS